LLFELRPCLKHEWRLLDLCVMAYNFLEQKLDNYTQKLRFNQGA